MTCNEWRVAASRMLRQGFGVEDISLRLDVPVDDVRQLERIYLDELPPDLGTYEAEPEAQCGIFCLLAEADMAGTK